MTPAQLLEVPDILNIRVDERPNPPVVKAGVTVRRTPLPFGRP